MDALVSVIIPVYNTGSCLRRCLDSVLDQTYRNFEIIAVDDGSTDKSSDILDEYAKKYDSFRVFHQPNSGQAAARNRALDAAKGEWISFVDSDDVCDPKMLEVLLRRAVRTGADACWGGHILHNIPRGTVCRRAPREGIYSGKALLSHYYRDPDGPAFIWAALFRRELFDGLRFPEGRIYEDTWILQKIVDRVNRAAFTEAPVYRYYLRKNGTINGSSVKKHIDLLWAREENLAFAKAHHPEWTGYAQKKLLECCADLMGRIDRAGRHNYPGYWKRVITSFEGAAKQLSGAGTQHKAAISLFNIDPVLFAKFCRLYAFMNFRLPIGGVRRDKKNAG